MEYPIHPYACIFPFHEDHIAALADHIAANGLEEPIKVYQNQILDGRRRLRACEIAGVEPRYETFYGNDIAALEYVVGKNLHRRHLTDHERVIVAARIATLKNGERPGSEQIPAPLPNGRATDMPYTAQTVAQSAEMLDVSERQVGRAKVVLEHGTPELQEAMVRGDVSISDAEAVAREPEEVQKAAVEAVAQGEAETLKGAAKKAPRTRKGDADESGAHKPAATDPRGLEVPRKLRDRLGDPWLLETMDMLAEAARKIREERLVEAATKRARHYPFFNSTRFIDTMHDLDPLLDQLIDLCRDGRPLYVCPRCEGQECCHCLQSGLVPKWKLDQLLEEA